MKILEAKNITKMFPGVIALDSVDVAFEPEAGLDDITQYLEVVTIFEDNDDAVYEGMKKTMDYLHKELGC